MTHGLLVFKKPGLGPSAWTIAYQKLGLCVKITKTKPEEGKKRSREVGNHLWQITIVSTDRKDLVTSNPVTLFKKKNDLKFNT